MIIDTLDVDGLRQALDVVVRHGGSVDHVYPPNVFIGSLPFHLVADPFLIPQVVLVTQDVVDEALLSQWGESARIAGHVWNRTAQGLPLAAPPARRKGVPRSPPGDALRVPDDGEPSLALAERIGPAPTTSQTSEFLIGTVTVAVIFPESNGAIDPSTENWTTARQDTVVTKVQEGLQWWKDNPNAPTNLTFVYDLYRGVSTEYEGISRPQSDHGTVVSDIMTSLGHSGTNQFAQVRSFLNARRAALGADWAFAVFVFDSFNDADGEFPDGTFAYAYVNGPYMIMTYDNNGWGIDLMNIVTAHENGHIWGALDEYASSGCTDAERSGYLDVANTNCENGDPPTEDSIMRGSANQEFVAWPNKLVSTPARQMVGWRDSDGDDIYDPVDTRPSVRLTSVPPDPTTDTTPTYAGTATDVPFASPTRADVTINTITAVEWRVDGGAWQPATATDGAFDSDAESFTFTSSALAPGTYLFEVRAINSVGNVSTIAQDTLTISATPGSFVLSVTKAGTGSGTVSSSPAGITCGADCSEGYSSGTAVTLTATAAAGSVFSGWTGGGCSGTGTCTVTLTADTTVTATFTRQVFTLTVTTAGSGSGTVSSAPAGITCGADCSEGYSSGTAVTLTATAAAGSVFSGWTGGGCSGTGTCTVTLTANTTVTATFGGCTVTGIGMGQTVSGALSTTDCRSSVRGSSYYADRYTFSASAGQQVAISLTSSAFDTYLYLIGPSGTVIAENDDGGGGLNSRIPAGSGFISLSSAGTYTIEVTSFATDATGSYTISTTSGIVLSVTRAGTGSGTVSSSPAGITCGIDCTENYPSGTTVTLTATASTGSLFGGWSGGGCSGLGTCTVSVTAATSVTATFVAETTPQTSLVAAVLPASRSVQVGVPATAFATIINAGRATASSCRVQPLTSVPVSFDFQTTNPATNEVTGSRNTPVDIAPGAAQSFVLTLRPNAPMNPTEVAFSFDCANTSPAPSIVGVNTLLLSASATPVPDIVAMAVTPTNDGIVNIAGATGTGVFSVAVANVGAGGAITVMADSGSALLPLTLSLCETNPSTGACVSPVGASVATTINANATPTFGVFAKGSGVIPFDPAINRIFVRFRDAGGLVRGATSVAVRTQ